MSFILDALKKSENDRQQQAPAEFATVPAAPEPSGAPRWLWVLAVLLAINVVVLLGVMLRPDSPSAPTAMPLSAAESVPAPAPANTAAEPAFVQQLEEARRRAPPARDETPVAAVTADATPGRAASAAEPAAANPFLPSLIELQVQGAVDLPPLHVDIHVFSETPSERFVFINMNKYRENERLEEGPLLREITREGAVLEYRGNAFLLPRE